MHVEKHHKMSAVGTHRFVGTQFVHHCSSIDVSVSGSVPCLVSGSVPGSVPGSVLVFALGSAPGTVPGSVPGSSLISVPVSVLGSSLSSVSGSSARSLVGSECCRGVLEADTAASSRGELRPHRVSENVRYKGVYQEIYGNAKLRDNRSVCQRK